MWLLFLQGELEEFEEGEGLGRQPSKISYKGAEGKIRRKGTITHIRDSVRSTKSAGGRSDVLPREKSQTALNSPDTPTSPAAKKQQKENEVELEMVTVHEKNMAA